MSRQEFHLAIESEYCSAVELIHQSSTLPKGEIKQAMQKGAVWLEDNKGIRRLRRAKAKLTAGSTLHFYHDAEVLNQNIANPFLIEDCQTYSIWFKPAGVLSQGSKWGDHCTINRWIETQDPQQRPAFIVHHLDRAACGLMVIAHGKKNRQSLRPTVREPRYRKGLPCSSARPTASSATNDNTRTG